MSRDYSDIIWDVVRQRLPVLRGQVAVILAR
jgi:hypothetical protein